LRFGIGMIRPSAAAGDLNDDDTDSITMPAARDNVAVCDSCGYSTGKQARV